jgi:tetratricopeptide (TPR) repeat protein
VRILISLLLLISLSVVANVSEETILRDCKGELAMGNYSSATLSFGRFIRNYPKSKYKSEALYWKGIAFLSDSKKDSAKATLELVAKTTSAWSSRANLSLGIILAGEKNWRASGEALKKAAAAGDSTMLSSVWYQLHLNAKANGEDKEASELKSRLLKHFPRSIEAANFEPEHSKYSLQLGAFQSKDNALQFSQNLSQNKSLGSWKPEITNQPRNGKTLHIVVLGHFITESDARDYAVGIGLAPKEFRVIPSSR